MIKILRQGLPVIGLAKIGESGGKTQGGKQRPPVKFDHIELTGTEFDNDGKRIPDVPLMISIMRACSIGDKVKDGLTLKTCGGCKRSKDLAAKWEGTPGIEWIATHGLPTAIPIMLPYNDEELTFPNRLAWYRGRTLFCSGDGIEAQRRTEITNGDQKEFSLPAPWSGPCGNDCPEFGKKCKPNARLRFILGGSEQVGGVYEFRTTSWNSIANIHESLNLISTLTHGILSWVPLTLEVNSQTVKPANAPASKQMIARVSFPAGPKELIHYARENLALQTPLVHEQKALQAEVWTDTPEEVSEFRAEFDADNVNEEGAGGEPVLQPAEAPVPSESSEPGDKVDDRPSSDTVAGDPSPGSDTDPRQRLSVEQRREIWKACQRRAKAFDPKGEDETLAARIMGEVIEATGHGTSKDVPAEFYDQLLADAQNAKRPEAA